MKLARSICGTDSISILVSNRRILIVLSIHRDLSYDWIIEYTWSMKRVELGLYNYLSGRLYFLISEGPSMHNKKNDNQSTAFATSQSKFQCMKPSINLPLTYQIYMDLIVLRSIPLCYAHVHN